MHKDIGLWSCVLAVPVFIGALVLTCQLSVPEWVEAFLPIVVMALGCGAMVLALDSLLRRQGTRALAWMGLAMGLAGGTLLLLWMLVHS